MPTTPPPLGLLGLLLASLASCSAHAPARRLTDWLPQTAEDFHARDTNTLAPPPIPADSPAAREQGALIASHQIACRASGVQCTLTAGEALGDALATGADTERCRQSNGDRLAEDCSSLLTAISSRENPSYSRDTRARSPLLDGYCTAMTKAGRGIAMSDHLFITNTAASDASRHAVIAEALLGVGERVALLLRPQLDKIGEKIQAHLPKSRTTLDLFRLNPDASPAPANVVFTFRGTPELQGQPASVVIREITSLVILGESSVRVAPSFTRPSYAPR